MHIDETESIDGAVNVGCVDLDTIRKVIDTKSGNLFAVVVRGISVEYRFSAQ